MVRAQTDAWKVYETKLAEPMQKQNGKTARQRYQTHERYLGYRNLIWVRPPHLDVQSHESVTHSLRSFLHRADRAGELDWRPTRSGSQTLLAAA